MKEFLLDASRMGVPQKRERVFFIGIRKDLADSLPQNEMLFFEDFPLLDLVFYEDKIPFSKIIHKSLSILLNSSGVINALAIT